MTQYGCCNNVVVAVLVAVVVLRSIVERCVALVDVAGVDVFDIAADVRADVVVSNLSPSSVGRRILLQCLPELQILGSVSGDF